MNLKYLKCFVEVANCMNLSNAAKNLYISQPALSQQIAIFERDLGLKLFERIGRTLKLTPAGEYLKNQSKKIFESEAQLLTEMKNLNCDESVSISLSMSASFFNNAATEFLKKFKTTYPMYDFSVTYSDPYDRVAGLMSGEYDAEIISVASFQNNEGIMDSYSICNFPMCAVVNQNHPLKDKSSAKLSDFKDDEFIVLSKNSNTYIRDILIKTAAKNNFIPNISRTHTTWNELFMYIALNNSVGIISSNHKKLAYFDNLYFIPIEDMDPFEYFLAWKHDNKSKILSAFTSLAKDFDWQNKMV